jgi:hypothetical protein
LTEYFNKIDPMLPFAKSQCCLGLANRRESDEQA